MSSSRRRKASMHVFAINCANRQHRIGLTSKGQLVALDHSPKLRRERHLAELGGELPACYHAVTGALPTGSWSGEPAAQTQGASLAWHRAASVADTRHKVRALNQVSTPLAEVMSFRERYQALTQAAVASYFPAQCYWRTEGGHLQASYRIYQGDTYRQKVELYRWPDGYPGDESVTWDDSRHPRGGTLTIRLPTRWWRQVHLKGIAVLGGLLVLDASWQGDTVDVLVMHQPRNPCLVSKFYPLLATLSAAVALGPTAQDIYFHPPWERR